MSEHIPSFDAPDKLYQHFFEEALMPMGLIQWDIDGPDKKFYITNANKSMMEILGIKSSDLPIRTSIAFTIFKGYHNHFLHLFLNNKEQQNIKITYQTSTQHFRSSFSKINKKVISFIFEEVTELQKHRTELFERKRQLKESHEIAKLGYWIENHDNKEHFWSEQIFRLLQIEENSFNPSFKKYLSFIHPDDKKNVEESFNESKNTHTGFEINHRIQLKDNTVKFVTLRCYTNYNAKGKAWQTVGIIQDISRLENTRIALHKSETIFRSVFENAPIAIVLVNKMLNPTFCNHQFSQITGYNMDELMQKNLADFTYPDDYENNKNQYLRLFNNEIDTFSLTKRYLKKDKTLLWVKVIVSAIKNEQNEIATAIAMVQDISAEKKASEALIKSEYRYRTLIENANDGIGLFDMNFKPIIYNTALYEMLGLTIEEYREIKQEKFERFHPDDIKYGELALEKIRQRQNFKIECRLRHSSGQYNYYALTYIQVLHEDKPAFLVFRRDITKRKEAELQNEEYRLFLETIMDNLPVSFFAKSTPGFHYIYWNHMMEQVSGISAEEALGKTDFEIIQSKKLAQEYTKEDEKLLKNNKKLEREHNFTTSTGEIKHFKTIKTLHQSPTGNPIILGLSMDISILKEAEQQIEQSTQMLKEAQKIAKLGYWEYDVKKDLFFENKENRQIIGTQDLPYFINSAQFKELVHPSDQDLVVASFHNCINNNKPGEAIIKIISGNELKHVSINYRPAVDEQNQVIKLRGTCLDITRIRKSEVALRESETRLKQAEHIAKVGYWDYNYKTKSTEFSDEVWNIMEVPHENKSFKLSEMLEMVHPEDKPLVYLQFQKSTATNQAFESEFRIITQNEHLKYIKATGTFVKTQKGELDRSIGTFQDITSIKQNEFNLQKITSHLLNVQKLSKTGYIEINLDNQETYFSDSLYNIIESTPGELNLSATSFNQFIYIEDKNTIEKTISKTINTKGFHNIQYRILLKNGTSKYINEICHIIPGDKTNPDIATRIIQDITHLKEKEVENLHFADIKRTAQIGTWEFNINTKSYEFSKEALEILALNKKNKLLSFEDYLELIHPNDRFSVQKLLEKSFKNRQDYTLTYRIGNSENEKIIYVQDNSSFIQTQSNNWQYKGTIRDITDYRVALHELSEHSELLKIITENSLMAMVILQNDKHIYVNKRWCALTGMMAPDVENKLSIHEIYQPETVRIILGLLVQWSKYHIKEYRNELQIKPLHAPEFYAEIYVKEIINNQAPAFLILVSPRHK